jgi:undecaprenyl-diphosphatase
MSIAMKNAGDALRFLFTSSLPDAFHIILWFVKYNIALEKKRMNSKPEIKSKAERTAKEEVTSQPKREMRTYLFELALLAAVGAFTTLTILAKTTPFFPVDVRVTHALQSLDSPFFSWLMIVISWPGFSPQAMVVSASVVLALYVFGFHWEALASVFASTLPPVINMIVKDAIQRPRPTADLVDVFRILDSYSFPSGHVMFYVGFFGFLWFLAYILLKRSLLRTSLLFLLGTFIALVGISRIYLGQHWASDVLGAYLLGSLTLVVNIWLYRWGKKRFFVRQPVAPEKSKTTTP